MESKKIKTNKYSIIIGNNLITDLLKYLDENNPINVVIVTSKQLLPNFKNYIENFKKNNINYKIFLIKDGEKIKNLKSVNKFLKFLNKNNIRRKDIIISFGGGSVNDFSGFVSSIWLRGIQFITIPTTLLAMVDASIGGKTGINYKKNKNIIGTFKEPNLVLVDISFLESLPKRELKSGLSEIIKTGLIYDESILKILENNSFKEIFDNKNILSEIINKAIIAKIEFISKDLFENDIRAFLNYGHTLGHAIEKVSGYKFSHGEAIAVGFIFAALISNELGFLSEEDMLYHYFILKKFDLPTTIKFKQFNSIQKAMLKDKKNIYNKQRFVILESLQNPKIVEDLDTKFIEKIYTKIRKK